MPLLVLNTNLPAEKIPKHFLSETSALVAKLLGKPEMYVCVRVSAGQLMSFGGDQEPCGFLELESIGAVGPDKNDNIVKKLGNHVEDSLGIEQDRFYIKITDVSRSDLGMKGKTFASMSK